MVFWVVRYLMMSWILYLVDILSVKSYFEMNLVWGVEKEMKMVMVMGVSRWFFYNVRLGLYGLE